MGILVALFLFISGAWAQINFERHELAFEYGLAYHTINGKQKSNNSEGRLTTDQMPYWQAAYTMRLGSKWGLRLFGGMQFARFDQPENGDLKNENQVMNQLGFEILSKPSVLSKFGVFIMQQDHPLYFAKTPTQFEMFKRSFIESGVNYTIGQRRRVGLLWGLGTKGFLIFPTEGGDVTTESGAGGELYARLGWVGPFGHLYQLKGFHQVTTQPNTEVSFTHTVTGYCFFYSFSY